MSRFKKWLPPKLDADGCAYPNADNKYQKLHCYGWRCFYPEKLLLGYGCDIGHGSFLQAKYGIKIDKDVQIGGGCYIYSESTINNKTGKIIIKENAKIGACSVILPGVTIGKNSVVGAGSVVLYGTKIPDNEVWVGIPCKKKGDIKHGK